MRAVRCASVLGLVLVTACVLAGCRSATETKDEKAAPSAKADAHTNDRMLLGSYMGTLPCADCRGIRTRLTLLTTDGQRTGEGTFTLSEEYLGTRDGNRRFERKGRWIITRGTPEDADAAVYELTFEDGRAVMNVRRMGAEALRVLDKDRREIDSNVKYTLARVREALPGGYQSLDADDPGAKSAAAFAVSEQSTRGGKPVALRRITRAEQQVVAGMNYRLCLEVTVGNVPGDAEAIVFRDLKQQLSLTRWSSAKCADPAP